MARLSDLVAYCDTRTRRSAFKDAPGAWNGLQLANEGRVTKIGAAVDAGVAWACRATVDAGAAANAAPAAPACRGAPACAAAASSARSAAARRCMVAATERAMRAVRRVGRRQARGRPLSKASRHDSSPLPFCALAAAAWLGALPVYSNCCRHR